MIKLKNVISLFDGMSCAQIALNKAGIEYENYFASEIDKYGQIVSKANFPNTKHIGDVRFVSYKNGVLTTQFGTFNIGKVDLLCGGSPCQSFSFAGKRKGMATKDEQEILTLDRYLQLKAEEYEFEGQSYLFWEYMRILTEIQAENPDVKFLLENVIMGEKWQTILTRAIGIQPIEINAALVSAQNRRRLFWTNIGAEPDGLFGDLVCKIPQPKDKGILLKDILEQEVDEKYFLSDRTIESLNNWKDRNKMAGNGFEPVVKDEFEKSASLTTGSMKSNATYIKIDKQGNKKQNQDKASCFTAGGHSGGNHSDMDLIIVHNMQPRCGDPAKGGTGHLTWSDGKTYCLDTGNTNAVEIVAMIGRNPENPKSRQSGLPTQQMLEPKNDGKTNCLTSVQKDNLVRQANYAIIGSGYEQDNRAYYEDGKTGTLDTKDSRNKILLTNSRIRRLTPIECERLQCVDDNFTNHVSDSQRYKMLGNGWNVDVIVHIFSHLQK